MVTPTQFDALGTLDVEPIVVFDWKKVSEREFHADIAPGWLAEVNQSLSDNSWSFRVNNSGRCSLPNKEDAISQAEEWARTGIAAAVESARKVFSAFSLFDAPAPTVVTDAMVQAFKKAFHEDVPADIAGNYDAQIKFALDAAFRGIAGTGTLTAADIEVLEHAVSRLPEEWSEEGCALLVKGKRLMAD